MSKSSDTFSHGYISCVVEDCNLIITHEDLTIQSVNLCNASVTAAGDYQVIGDGISAVTFGPLDFIELGKSLESIMDLIVSCKNGGGGPVTVDGDVVANVNKVIKLPFKDSEGNYCELQVCVDSDQTPVGYWDPSTGSVMQTGSPEAAGFAPCKEEGQAGTVDTDDIVIAENYTKGGTICRKRIAEVEFTFIGFTLNLPVSQGGPVVDPTAGLAEITFGDQSCPMDFELTYLENLEIALTKFVGVGNYEIIVDTSDEANTVYKVNLLNGECSDSLSVFTGADTKLIFGEGERDCKVELCAWYRGGEFIGYIDTAASPSVYLTEADVEANYDECEKEVKERFINPTPCVMYATDDIKKQTPINLIEYFDCESNQFVQFEPTTEVIEDNIFDNIKYIKMSLQVGMPNELKPVVTPMLPYDFCPDADFSGTFQDLLDIALADPQFVLPDGTPPDAILEINVLGEYKGNPCGDGVTTTQGFTIIDEGGNVKGYGGGKGQCFKANYTDQDCDNAADTCVSPDIILEMPAGSGLTFSIIGIKKDDDPTTPATGEKREAEGDARV